MSNKAVETDPEFKKSSLSLSLPEGREAGFTSGYMMTLNPTHGAASMLTYGPKREETKDSLFLS